jgi:hypothetical protein
MFLSSGEEAHDSANNSSLAHKRVNSIINAWQFISKSCPGGEAIRQNVIELLYVFYNFINQFISSVYLLEVKSIFIDQKNMFFVYLYIALTFYQIF